MSERDYTSDYEDWLREQQRLHGGVPDYQGKPEPPWVAPWDPYAGDFNNVPRPEPTPTPVPTPNEFFVEPIPNTPFGGPSYDYQAPVARPAPSGDLNQTYPQFNAPQFAAPAPFSYGEFKYDPFAYESFKAPTLAEAQAEPGFEFALNQGLKAMEHSKAYAGTYRTGGTIKGLNDYARSAANQNYTNVFERQGQTYDRNRGNAYSAWQGNRDNAFGNWSGNRENAADAYAMNYGVSRDVFDRTYQGAKDEYAPKARASELQFGRDWDQYAYEGDDSYRRWKAMIDANTV